MALEPVTEITVEDLFRQQLNTADGNSTARQVVDRILFPALDADRQSLKPPDPIDTADEEVRVYPYLTYYYGLGPRELSTLPRNLIRLYATELPKIQAAEQLQAINAASYAWMGEEAQRSIIDSLYETIGVSPTAAATEMSVEEIMRQADADHSTDSPLPGFILIEKTE